jgi:hypothetical protein
MRCEHPIGENFSLSILYNDGREERVHNEIRPEKSGEYVLVYVDSVCPRGRPRSLRRDRCASEDGPVEYGGRTYSTDDLEIKTEGSRFLLILPKNVAAPVGN